MEAQLVETLPDGAGWQYEPKWDGFRCLAFRDGDEVHLQSKSGQPLARYFPELVHAVGALAPRRFVLDGEIVVPMDGRLSFDDLLQRIHPAQSRVRRLAEERPALLIAFDLLAAPPAGGLAQAPLSARRQALERFAAEHFRPDGRIMLSRVTRDREQAERWLRGASGAVDGVVAKRLDLGYQSGERTGMQKVKRLRTAECVVGGFRYAAGTRTLGSLLLGLYDDEGQLHHVGFAASFTRAQRRDMLARVRPLVQAPGFTGRAPGGPSRWNPAGAPEWEPLRPVLVAEVRYDHFTGGRFRHGTRFLRWRPDKKPRQCTLAQVEAEATRSLGQWLSDEGTGRVASTHRRRRAAETGETHGTQVGPRRRARG
jgi:ATP-dependent DNA ligase